MLELNFYYPRCIHQFLKVKRTLTRSPHLRHCMFCGSWAFCYLGNLEDGGVEQSTGVLTSKLLMCTLRVFQCETPGCLQIS